MFFKKYCEFIEAIYNIYYSYSSDINKNNKLLKIFNEYKSNKVKNKDFEEIYYDLINKKYNHTLLKSEINFLSSFNGRIMSIKELLNLNIKIHLITESSYIQTIKPVTKFNNDFHCFVCDNTKNNLFFTYKFNNEVIHYCTNCIEFGRCDSFLPKFLITFPTIKNNFELTLPKVMLSPPQKQASDKLLENSCRNKKTLIWAVCGAGKTEIIYNTIYNYIKNNKIVCLAVPRKDVVKELYLRLKKDFNIPINILHGDEKNLILSPLYIMTTHQVLKYYKYFDLLIIDEVDAFPYYGDKLLEKGTMRSLKNNAPFIFLSATPSKKIKNLVDEIIIIPIRYHKNLLPIPKIKVYKKIISDISNNKIPEEIKKFIELTRMKKRKALIFVPSIDLCNKITKILNNNYSPILGTNSKDLNRNETIEKMYNNKQDIIVTTTILERGVTFDYLDVMIVQADHEHFTKESLIQIAGRVGRKAYSPSGEIIFLTEAITRNIKKAIKDIKYMNTLAQYRKLDKEKN